MLGVCGRELPGCDGRIASAGLWEGAETMVATICRQQLNGQRSRDDKKSQWQEGKKGGCAEVI